jgi:hypothetical protein
MVESVLSGSVRVVCQEGPQIAGGLDPGRLVARHTPEDQQAKTFLVP